MGVIIGLMVLDVADMTLGSGAIFLTLLRLVTGDISSSWAIYLSFSFVPTIICLLILLTRRYRLLWTALIPSVATFVVWNTVFLGSFDGGGGLLPIIKFIPTCIIVLLSYLCVFIATKVKQKKEKER